MLTADDFKIEDKFLLSRLTAKRAEDMINGKRPITKELERNVVSQAAKEIKMGLIKEK